MKKILLSILYFLAYIFSIQAQTLYGTTSNGGSFGAGTINKFIPATNALTVLKSFEGGLASRPVYTNFVQANNGKLYAVTSEGGRSNKGVIFSFDPASFSYLKLIDFDGTNGAEPTGSLLQATDGKLYGMTSKGGTNNNGVIFSFNPVSFTYTKLKDFDYSTGAEPYGSLIQASDGKLYGMTVSGGSNGGYGVIFSYDPSSAIYTKLKDFHGTDGSYPLGSLMQASDGKLYGMTRNGGTSGAGVIFSFDPSSSNYKKLLDFGSTNGKYPVGSLSQASNGKLYGVTSEGGSSVFYGVIFSFDPSSANYKKLVDFDLTNGGYPNGSLIQATNGKLYGVTSKGGSDHKGVIFCFDPSSSTYTKQEVFNWINGYGAQGGFIQSSDGKLYAMTSHGGASDAGVIFSFDPASSRFTRLKDIAGNKDGSKVTGSLIQALDQKLYGITRIGGSNGYGAIFSVDPSSSTFTKLKDFDGTHGGYPWGSLMLAKNGNLYGMTTNGGVGDAGVIFSFEPSSSTYTELYEFKYDTIFSNYPDGAYPYGSLMQASDGKLYGMTTYGGSSGYGVIFSFDPFSSTYKKLQDFDELHGRPAGSLIEAGDGKLYGLAPGEATDEIASLPNFFSFDPSSSTFKIVKEFYSDSTYEGEPFGSLIRASDGKLYGMTSGIIFSFDPSSSKYTRLNDFDGINGFFPQGSLLQASNGKLYGMTSEGGTSNLGVIFSFDPSTSTYIKLKDYNGDNGASPGIGSAFIEVHQSNTPPAVTPCHAS